jgi:proteasome lid subunit RPN8/RPN11
MTTLRANDLSVERLREILRQAEAGYPEEVCGAVIGRRGEPGTYEVRPLPNVANREGPRGPDGRARDARTAYLADPVAECRLLKELEDSGREIVVFYHSHPDADAYFSAMDRELALLGGREPWWPGVRYLVISVRGGRANGAALFAWDPGRHEFMEQPVPVPVPEGTGPS